MKNLDVIRAENRTLPANERNEIVSPLYVPKGDPYLEKWRDYCRVTTALERPAWLEQDLQFMRQPNRAKPMGGRMIT